MYAIEMTSWGLQVRLAGTLTVDEADAWGQEMSQARRDLATRAWALLLDLSGLDPLPRTVGEIIERTMARASNAGMACLCVVTDSYVGGIQAKTIWKNATESTPGKLIDARDGAEWRESAETWIVRRLDALAA